LLLAKYDVNKNGRLDPDEVETMEAAQRAAAGLNPTAAKNNSSETVVLSPFEVVAQDRGYYASNTMSGTRLNSKVEDLASSITVITKEQMTDFALLDINDVFLYEASTEGTGTYTEFSVDRNGSPVDNSLNPNSANRVRGVGPANISFGNFETSGRVPIDPINIDAVEISRGPNSTVFGLGNAAGTVNMQPASANVSRDRSQLGLRVDNWDGYRTSIDLNRVLKKGVLAARGSAVYQHDGFVRKPSGTDTTRLNGMIRYQPFKYTSITASHSYYHIQGNRPNTTTPRDAVTGWKNAGSPTWDPVTTSAKINGVRVPGTFTATSLPAYFSNANFRTQSTLFIDNNGSIGFWSPSRTTSTTNPDTGNQNVVLVNTVPDPIRATQPLFSSDPSVSSKALYDWSTINLAAMNHIHESTGTTHIQVDQIFFDTPRNMLALQAGYFREDSQRRNRNLLGTAGSSGATGFLHVDVNERMIDGSPNPFFLRPFIGIYNVKAIQEGPSNRETYRAQLAYRLDLRREKNRLSWLGMHQISGYAEYKNSRSRNSIFRDVILSNHSWYPAPTGTARDFTRPNVALNYYRYYVGDNQGQNADQPPHDFAPGVYPYRWGNGVTGQFVTEQAKLGPGFWYDSVTAYGRSLIKTRGGVIQSHLLGGRVVTTLGLRDDRRFNRSGGDPLFHAGPDGEITLDYDSIQQMDPEWTQNRGKTKTAGAVVKPTRWLNLYANASDSFQPAGTAVGLFLQQLPDPTGTGKDYGFSLNLFDGKLVARVNRYETTQIDTRNGSARTLAQRVRAMDFDAPYSNVGLVVRARDWVTNAATAQGRTLTPDQINQEVAKIAQLDIAYLTRRETRDEQNSLVAETQDVTAKGTEIEVNYNPTNYWTTKLNVTKTESIDSKLAPGISTWIAQRLPVWQSIIDPEIGRPWFTERYGGSSSASQYLASNVTSQLNIAKANEGKSRPQIRKYRANISTSYRLAGLTDQQFMKRFTVGGALRWEDKGAIGYYGVQQLPAVITDLDPNRPIYDKARLYADAFVAYRTRMFSNKVGATFQLNVRNIQENGRLQAISAFPDGTPNGYRIVDPRQFILSATFDL
jgi:outer membrane receptor protein involved in Fe transport